MLGRWSNEYLELGGRHCRLTRSPWVRGEDLVDDDTALQAERFRRRFPDWGRWGLSAMHADSEEDVDDLGAGPLRRFLILALYRVAALEADGFEVVPTFRTPHVSAG